MSKRVRGDYETLRLAVDIHRRAVKLQAHWTEFDPYGAVVYHLSDLVEAAWGLREAVFYTKDDWSLAVMYWNGSRTIGKGLTSHYDLFKAQIKGIEGAIRRLQKVPYSRRIVGADCFIAAMKSTLQELKAQA